MMNDLMQQFITFLQAKGLTPEQIATECETVTWAATEKFYEELRTVFTPEDNQAIDAIVDQTQAEDEMKKRYVTNTGKDPQEVMTRLLGEIAKQSMDEYGSSSAPITAQ